MANQQEEKLRQEILGDARLKAERTIARAMVNGDKLLENALETAEAKRKQRLEKAMATADKRCSSILMDVQREVRRYWLQGREKCIDDLFAQALAQAEQTSGERHERSLRTLAQEAMKAIGCRDMKVQFPTNDAAIVTLTWLQKIAENLFQGKTPRFELDPKTDAAPGLKFVTLDEQRAFDNTYASRLEKMHEQLRRQLVK